MVLRDDIGLSQTEIASRIPTSCRTVYSVLKKFDETGSVHDKPGRGPKHKLTLEDEKKIVKRAKQGKSAAEIAIQADIAVSDRSVRRVLKKNHLAYLRIKRVPRLTSTHKEQRLTYAAEKINAEWRKVLFLDEKSFWLETTTTHCWQIPGEERKKIEKSRWTKKLHVFGGIGYYCKTKLYFFTSNLNGELYQDIIQQRLPPAHFANDTPRRFRDKWVVVQDNDPKHKTNESMQLLRQLCNNRLYDHPANSPDFNVMEDAWSYLDREVRKSKIRTINGLKRRLTQLWEDLPWNYIRKSVDSMPARLQQCLDRKGARTDY